ncbi:MAG: hypothetical protein RIQ61_1449 [Bacteroidota bacterium]
MEKQDKSLQVSQLNQDLVIERLPNMLKESIVQFKTEEQRLIALYSISTLTGSLMPEVCIRYADKIEHPCLYLLISMPPASGKGGLNLLYKLVEEVNLKMRSNNEAALTEYLREVKAIEDLKDKSIPVPKPPKQPLHLIPGNTTSSKLNEQMAENDGVVSSLIMETETDGLTMMLSNKMGEANSVLFRKSFHHEFESQLRKRKGEHLVITRPKLAIIVSGTPSQIKGLFKGNEDGLFSRFMIMTGNSPLEWMDVRPKEGEVSMDEKFKAYSKSFSALYEHFNGRNLEVKFSPFHWDKINSVGKDFMIQATEEAGPYAASIGKRHTNMLCRMAAIFTAIRHFETKSISEEIYCSGIDFENALWLINESFKSSLAVFKTLPGKIVKGKSKKYEFLEGLPEHFILSEQKEVYESLNISYRTAGRYLEQLCDEGLVLSVGHPKYKKIN